MDAGKDMSLECQMMVYYNTVKYEKLSEKNRETSQHNTWLENSKAGYSNLTSLNNVKLI